MLRSMLAERFGLKAHIENRITTLFTLSFSKPSPNLKESAPGVISEEERGIRTFGAPHKIRIVARQVSMEKLVDMLGFYLWTEVVDRTGLTKLYDFEVAFDPHPDQPADTPDAAPPAEVALPEQLGLKLTRGKGPVKTLVVDALTMPTPN